MRWYLKHHWEAKWNTHIKPRGLSIWISQQILKGVWNPPLFGCCVQYVPWLDLRSRIKLNISFMCIYDCDQTCDGQKDSNLPSLNPNCSNVKCISSLGFFFFPIFLEIKFLKCYRPKARATLPLFLPWMEVPGRALLDERQGHLSSGSEQSRPKRWGWRSGASFIRAGLQFMYSCIRICWFRHFFCKGSCKGRRPN